MADRPVRGFGVAAGLDPEIGADVARRCEEHGFASLWSNDHPMASGLETAALFAGATGRPDAGVAVLALDRHSPPDVAAKIAALEIEPSRLWVGIGAGFTKTPLATVREGLAAMRGTLPAGTRVAVAAMGPKMCRLAGAEADGVFLNWMTPERAAWVRERIDEGVRESGRAQPPVVFGYVRVAVGADAGERLLKEESFYRGLHRGYIQHFESLGAPEGTVGVAAPEASAVPDLLAPFERDVDHVVVRALAHADVESLAAVAEAAAPATAQTA
jgi:alkanesulfonate monooxygenase SsuD/methylene tetrahydromethanopterin reductase-like flavin-dependent oxidoreductase (luciferase family)